MADEISLLPTERRRSFAPFNNSTKITLTSINTLVSTYAHFKTDFISFVCFKVHITTNNRKNAHYNYYYN